MRSKRLISCKDLTDSLLNKNLCIIDCCYKYPEQKNLDLLSLHFSKRIPYSKFFDMSQIRDKSSSFPNMMPSEQNFISMMKKLKIRKSSQIVCYDQFGILFSPRVQFTFKVFGHQNVLVLDGGLPKWIQQGYPTQQGEYQVYQSTQNQPDQEYQYKYQKALIKDYDHISLISHLLTMNKPQTLTQIIDGRSPRRFLGMLKQMENIRPGNILGSKNIPYNLLMNNDHTMRSDQEIKQIFLENGVNFDQDSLSIHSCRQGIESCINIMAMEILGKQNLALYDGSWSQFGSYPEQKSPSLKAMLENEYQKDLKKRKFQLKKFQ